LRPFEVSEEHLFFGREREVNVLLNLISTLPVLIIYARSGTGKSSLLNAGVAPLLAGDPAQAPVFVSTTEADIAASVRGELMNSVRDDPINSEWACEEGLALHEVLHRFWAATDKRPVIILDQFEERLNSGMKHSDLYSAIARLVNEGSDAACVVLSIREDYLGGLEPLMRRVPSLLNASYRVPPLSRLALEQAIYGPLKHDETTTVENALVERTMLDLHERQDQTQLASEQAFEPGYFQIVWSTLWEKGQRSTKNRLTVKLYRDLGGASAILKNFTTVRLGALEPAEAHLFWAMSRYLVLPTGAKVALTVEDLILLQKETDYLSLGSGGAVWIAGLPPDQLTALAKRVLRALTSSQSPLFRRMMRDGREEFELLHDLLAMIILEWRSDFAESFNQEVRRKTDEINRRSAEIRKAAFTSAASGIDAMDDDGRSWLRGQGPMEQERIPPDVDMKELLGFRRLVRDAASRSSAIRDRMSEGMWLESSAVAEDLARESEWLLAVSAVADAVFGALYYERLSITQKVWTKAKDRFLAALRPLAFVHPSPDVRRVAQEQRVYWQAELRGRGFTRLRTEVESQPRGDIWPAVRKFVAISAITLVVAVGPLILGNLLILTLFDPFHLQYTWLSVGIICLGAVFLYALLIYDQWPLNNRRALPEALFPSLADTSSEHEWWSFAAWWPIPLLTVSGLSALGAWIFDIAGWSSTAGFNVGLLAGATAGLFVLAGQL